MPTKIEWTDETWNPVTGCTPISAGCKNCYAERMARRLAGRCWYPEYPHHFNVTIHPDKLDYPSGLKKPRKIFVCSMGDLFHKDVSIMGQELVFNEIERNPQHTFIVLTKRPENMYRFFKHYYGETSLLKNIWLGVTCENQRTADERIPWLMQTPAAVRFVSIEPMLERIYMKLNTSASDANPPKDGCWYNVLAGTKGRLWGAGGFPKLDWVICGGETGPGAREMKEHWVVDLYQQCKDAGTPFFFKKPGDAYQGSTDHPAFSCREYPKESEE